MPNYSEEQKKQILEDVLDPDKIAVFCGVHNYYGPVKGRPEIGPGAGCSRCWFVYFLHDIATTPPHARQARLDELEEVIHHVVESVEKGNWDFKPSERPEITFERDAE